MENQLSIYLIVFFISFALFFAAVIILFRQYRQNQQTAIKEKSMREQAHRQEIMATRLEIQQQTMQYIGREIHDNIGQQLTLAALYTQQMDYENKAPQLRPRIEHIGTIINHSLAELRQLSKSLTDDTIAENGIVALIQNECKKVADLRQCSCELRTSPLHAVLSYQEKNILLRIVQEFIQNSLKHAGCQKITVHLEESESRIRLVLRDDGKGFDINSPTNGIGLKSMEKRAGLIGGSFQLQSGPQSGTSVTIEIPQP